MTEDAATAARERVPPKHWPNGRARGVQRISYTHLAIIDALLANPCITQQQLAERFGYTPGWVGQILASEAFQRRLTERVTQLVNPTIRATLEERCEALVLRSLDILQEKLNEPASQVPDQLALRAFELSARVAGYDRQAKPEPPMVQVNIQNHREVLGNNLTKFLRERSAGVDRSYDPEASSA